MRRWSNHRAKPIDLAAGRAATCKPIQAIGIQDRQGKKRFGEQMSAARQTSRGGISYPK